MSKLAAVRTAAMKPLVDMHKKVPRDRLIEKYVKTGFGAIVFVGSFFLPKFFGFPHWTATVVAAFGGFLMSQDLFKKFVAILPAAVGALKGAKPDA